MSHRRIEHLNNNRIIYRRLPIIDKPSHSFDWGYYYIDGTYEFYDLFRSKALINTYKSLRWHLRVIWYLNPQLSLEEFKKICNFIADKRNGFITFNMLPDKLNNIIKDINKSDLEEPPQNKLRKITMSHGFVNFVKRHSGMKSSGKIMSRVRNMCRCLKNWGVLIQEVNRVKRR